MQPSTRRSLFALVLALAVVGAVVLPAAAVAEPREAPEDKSPPVRVYVSETLDVSAVQLSGTGETIGTEQTTFVSVTGDEVFTVRPTSADFDDVVPGSYYVDRDSDLSAELSVVEPRVIELTLRNERGVNVTRDTVEPDDLEQLTVMARYNFGEADRLDVTVENPSGLDLAGNRVITQSGQTVTVDVDDAEPGVYTVTVEGSNIEAGTRTTQVTVAGGETATPTATATETATATPTATEAATATPTATETATATPTATETATATSTPTATQTQTASPTPTEGGGPGFGVAAAVAALLAAARLARWRR